MSSFKENILSVLEKIKGNGSFANAGSASFQFPGLEIRGVGEIGFPISPLAAKEMINVAHKAPFGKGSETVLDPSVRSAWEIDAAQLSFNAQWNGFIEKIINQVKPGLGIEEHAVSANLYKLLIYEKGDFFLTHKDSEKENGMFGTLIIGLPSKHTGGKLVVKFDGKTETIDFSADADQYKIAYAAFYADCEHEIKPLTSGYRVCLVYNLVQNKGTEKIQMGRLQGHVEQLTVILKGVEDSTGFPKIILLGHQYTPANFTMEALKLNDRPKAEALIMAAQKSGFHIKLGLVTSYQAGQLEIDYSKKTSKSRGKGRYYGDFEDFDDDELLENGIMGEIFDDGIRIEHWMYEGVPPLRNIACEEDALITALTLNEGDPIEKEAEGYTGNAGMEMYYWYHYGAVILWPKKHQFKILTGIDDGNKLEWIRWYNRNWDDIDADEKTLTKKLIAEGLNGKTLNYQLDYSPVARLLVNLKDEKYFTEIGLPFLAGYFEHIAISAWVDLFKTYPTSYFTTIFKTMGEQKKAATVSQILEILINLHKGPDDCTAFVTDQVNRIPAYISAIDLSGKTTPTMAKGVLLNTFELSKLKTSDLAWLENAKLAFTNTLSNGYVDDVLVKVILEKGKGIILARRIMQVCEEHLLNRVNHKPLPPADWSRPVPVTSGSYRKVWAILADFLRSPTQQSFDFQKLQGERIEMVNAISSVTIDLKTETIKKGSPHTLRLTKTQNAYEQNLIKWHADVDLLRKVKDFNGAY